MQCQRGARADSSDVKSLYGTEYAAAYEAYYLSPWQRKHRTNVAVVARTLGSRTLSRQRWLDLCCGQAWHFAQFPSTIEKVGVDVSAAQLERAAARNPDAAFVRADVRSVAFSPGTFDLVTCFWGAYCYLDDADEIARLVRRAADWTAPGGALYFEVLLGRDLATFNDSPYAERTGFRVTPLTEDYGRWSYRDAAGTHVMTSPPLELFIRAASRSYGRVDAEHDDGFMTHVVALDRRASPPEDRTPQRQESPYYNTTEVLP